MPNVNRTILVSGGLALAAFLAIGFTLASPARRATPAPPRPEPVAGGDVGRLASAPHMHVVWAWPRLKIPTLPSVSRT
jgi:hypothetical protein